MKTSPARLLFHPFVLSLCAALVVAGCASTKDAASRDAIASLKTVHLAFIDEYTEGKRKTWDEEKLTARIAVIEKRFTDAEQSPSAKKDARRLAAITSLHSQFKRDAATLQRRKAFYRVKFAGQLKDQVTQNYDQALRGEDIRS